jgi:hypothetical protein
MAKRTKVNFRFKKKKYRGETKRKKNIWERLCRNNISGIQIYPIKKEEEISYKRCSVCNELSKKIENRNICKKCWKDFVCYTCGNDKITFIYCCDNCIHKFLDNTEILKQNEEMVRKETLEEVEKELNKLFKLINAIEMLIYKDVEKFNIVGQNRCDIVVYRFNNIRDKMEQIKQKIKELKEK